MIFRTLFSFVIVYLALILEVCCSKQLPAAWGRPQFLFLVMIWLASRTSRGTSVVFGAGLGFLADSLEPTGMGRFFLLYSLVAWCWSRSNETHRGSLRKPTLPLIIGFLTLTTLIAVEALGFLLEARPMNLTLTLYEILASTGWTTLCAIPLVFALPRENHHRDSPSRSSRASYRWNMLTNS